MPRGLTAGMLTEVAAQVKRPRWFADLEFTSGHLYLWTGFQDISWSGQTWTAVGNLGSISPIRNGSEVRADGVTLSLSGVSSSNLALALGSVRQGKAAKVYLGMVDEAGAIVVDPVLAFSGFMDVPSIEEAGDTCTITISAESRLARLRPHEDILSRMLTAMAGTLVHAEGKWHIHAGAHTSSVQTITEDDLTGPIRITSRLPRNELFNRVKGTFASPLNKYLPTDYPVVVNATYVTEDGEALIRDHDLPFTQSFATAQRLAKIELEAARQQITVALACKLTCFQIRPPDNVALTISRLGWSGKLFRCTESVIDIEGDAIVVRLQLRETASSIYTWTAEETAVDPAPDTSLPDPFLMTAVTGLAISVTSVSAEDGLKYAAARADWTAPAGTDGGRVEYYEVQWRRNGPPSGQDTKYDTTTRVPSDEVRHTYYPVTVGSSYYVRVRAIGKGGIASAWVEAGPTTITTTSQDYTGTLRGRGSWLVSRGAEGVLFHPFSTLDGWEKNSGTTATLVTGVVGPGGYAMQVAGGEAIYQGTENVPFDPFHIYRVSIRVRMTAAPSDSAKDLVSLGLQGYAENGTTKVGTDGTDVLTLPHYVVSDYDMGSETLSAWVELSGFIYGFGASVGTSGNYDDGASPGQMHPNVRWFRPIFRLNAAAGNGTMQVSYISVKRSDPDATGRVYGTLSRTLGRLRTGTRIERPTDSVPVTRGRLTGLAKDGDAITFSPAFPSGVTPSVQVLQHSALTFYYTGSAPWNAAATQRNAFEALSVTNTGFTVKAKVSSQASGFTARTAAFSGTADAVAETVSATKTEAAEATDDVYTFQFDLTVNARQKVGYMEWEDSAVTIAFETRPAGGGAWTTRWTETWYNSTSSPVTYSNTERAVTADGQAANSEFRMRITALEQNGGTLTGDQVEWSEASSSPTEVSATPNSDNYVRWIAEEVT